MTYQVTNIENHQTVKIESKQIVNSLNNVFFFSFFGLDMAFKD